jgi:hypothetical protein
VLWVGSPRGVWPLWLQEAQALLASLLGCGGVAAREVQADADWQPLRGRAWLESLLASTAGGEGGADGVAM